MQYYDKKEVGKRIQQVRKSKNLTQCALAAKLDYTKERQIQRIEYGETACPVDRLMEIAQILNVSTDYLLFGAKQENTRCFEEILAGKSEQEKFYLWKILKVAAENMESLK